MLTSTQRVDRLKSALLRAAMTGIGAIGDFSAEELAEIADILQTHGFDPKEFGLAEGQS
ncbi:MAG: hypothetical protein HC781_20485 [Leptolyngbyaceae cyanobacterium CSU_1_4]|nr:hypothetical protein [Leptolyngbyaceae cyanobacterium CSU_1_4]